MRYLSLCSGIEAASVAWHPLGWRPFAFSEIDAFPSALLAHHYPETPNLGDMSQFQGWPDATFDILVGGTPCQSFSVAGLRKGLHDPRGNLMLTFGAIAARYRPAWLVWENVPGVLSSNVGRDFGTFLGMLGELGYGFAYRVLDAQFFGVPQRRRRVFVVGYLGNWRPAFAVLFERHGLQGHPAPRREARKGIAGSVAGCLGGSSQSGGFRTTDLDGTGAFVPVAGDAALETVATCPTLRAGGNRTGGDRPPGTDVDTADSLIVMSSGQANAEISHDRAPTLNCLHEAPILAAHSVIPTHETVGTLCAENSPHGPRGFTGLQQMLAGYIQPVAMAIRTANTGANGHGVAEEVAHTLDQAQGQAVAFKASHYTRGKDGAPQEVAPPLSADADKGDQDTLSAYQSSDYKTGDFAKVDVAGPVTTTENRTRGAPVVRAPAMQVRRLTPRECERLQGFPDDYTLIQVRGKPAADGPRYKALGNSMAVPVMAWIGERIQLVDGILAEQAKAAE